jgi:cell division protein FtsQ
MRFRIKKWVQIFLMACVIFSAIGFVEKKHSDKICSRIHVQIENNLGNYFIHENDIIGLITNNGIDPLVGNEFKNIDLKNLELRIKTNKFIRNCQVSRNLKGELLVEVQQSVPIARVVQADAPDAYISHTGQILPLSDRYTARVVLIQGEYTRKLLSLDFSASEEGKPFFELLRTIDQDPFWKAQIAELYVDRNGEITILPQVGRQVIEFGAPVDMKAKFGKLKLFYKQILPAKGWNRYAKVSVKYRNQIICE